MTLRQSFAWWSFTWGHECDPGRLLQAATRIGYAGVDMLDRQHWPLARDAGLELVNITGQSSMEVGFNDPVNHADLHDEVRENLDLADREGVAALIVFAGTRRGRTDADAAAVAAEGLAPLAVDAEAAGVTLLLELLNSAVDHPGYQGDHTDWGAQVVEAVGSPALRLLYDAYHMQIMEGDIIRTVSRVAPLIGQVHTAGVPGRRDLDERQELNYRPIIRTLVRVGYDGFVGHEFLPRGDPEDALRSAFEMVDLASVLPAATPA